MRRLSIALAAALLAAAGCSTSPDPVLIGAVYPTGGSQGAGGIQELRGVRLAARLANSRGGLDGRPFQLVESPAGAAEAAPGAVESVVSRGASVVLGSYGSTISAPAAETSAGLDAVFWETGAVGEIDEDARPGERFFRVVSPGTSLGVAAVGFVEDTLLPKMEVPDDLRYAVVYVDDAYGRTIGHGALAEIGRRGLGEALDMPYRLDDVDFDAVARRLLRARTDVLVVAAYLEDGIEMRRAVLRAGVPLVASIGTSSSYCMHAFGVALGEDAVGLFASDKPDGETLDPAAL
ncbi:MAG TPA: ABC transporter substrate-binding protein, partial [Actinomycetota bacterium]